MFVQHSKIQYYFTNNIAMDVHVGSPCSARNMIADHLHSSGTDAELICLGDEIEAADETTLR